MLNKKFLPIGAVAIAAGTVTLLAACSAPQPDRSAPFSLGGESVVMGFTPTPSPFIPKGEEKGHGAPGDGHAQPTAAPAQSPSAGGAGEQIFKSAGCTACHTIQGVQGATGTVGPELTHIATVAGTRREGVAAEAYIRQSVLEPGAFIAPGFANMMPPGLVKEGPDLDALVAFLMTKQ